MGKITHGLHTPSGRGASAKQADPPCTCAAQQYGRGMQHIGPLRGDGVELHSIEYLQDFFYSVFQPTRGHPPSSLRWDKGS